uniref:Uncharacterized protein n=1 Tax=Strigamia maritima TaxID=126957 RepID=T1J9H0_STRMM
MTRSNARRRYPTYGNHNIVIFNFHREPVIRSDENEPPLSPIAEQSVPRCPLPTTGEMSTGAISYWMFLGWFSQMLSLLDKEEEGGVYPFKLSREGYKLNDTCQGFVASSERDILECNDSRNKDLANYYLNRNPGRLWCLTINTLLYFLIYRWRFSSRITSLSHPSGALKYF